MRLLTALGATAAHTAAWPGNAAAAATSAGYDLIFLEGFEMVPAEIESILGYVRVYTKAPLVVLTGDAPVEHSAMALTAGADAVIPVTVRQELIAAHCSALIRRWRRFHLTPLQAVAAPIAQFT